MTIFDRTMQLLAHTLDLRSTRQRVLASNIANEETPGYRAADFHFLDQLASAQRGRPPVTPVSTHAGHIGAMSEGEPPVKGRLVVNPATDLPLDANTVNLDLELAKMSDNAMQYNTTATILAMRLRQLLSAIREGR